MSSLLETYVESLRKRIASEAEAIADGRPGTLEDYRQRVGYLRGLKWALTELEDMWKKTTKEGR